MKSRHLFSGVFLLAFFAFVMACPGAYALTKSQRDSIPHEVRIGWGDMLFETAVWHKNAATDRYRYTGHLFAEYQYHFFPWLSLGAQMDYEQVWWDVLKRGSQLLDTPERNRCFYNVSLIPTVRFTYYHHHYVNLYSALGIGLTINGGTETDMLGRHTACAPVLSLTVLGLRVGEEHWFGAVEIGGLNALTGKDAIYMLGSRLFTASVGYNF
ncbi:MAG: hypothetical protein ACI30A_03335 [Paludibacteraceae bacterium]